MAKAKKDPEATGLWVPGQGAVKIGEHFVKLPERHERFCIGFSTFNNWWIVFGEISRHTFIDGWATEAKALKWAQQNMATAIKP